MKTLILGLGNAILSDDGVGIYVVRELRDRVNRRDVEVVETGLAGLRLLDILTGYDKAIIVDAIESGKGSAGDIYRLTPDDFEAAKHLSSVHDMDFTTALDFGRKSGLALPSQIVIYAVEVADTTTFSEECTPPVKEAIPVCVEMILRELAVNNDA
jgi:hydrogenase maturation protease